jgi:hypothetical protein
VNATTLIFLLLLLACPLSMVFMHRGSGGHKHGSADDSQNRATASDREALASEAPQAHGCCGHAGHGESSRRDHSKTGTPA